MSEQIPTPSTMDLVNRWTAADTRVVQLNSQLHSAECERDNAVISLGKWLTPEDAKPGEVFNVWIESRLLCVQVSPTGRNNFQLSWRKREK